MANCSLVAGQLKPRGTFQDGEDPLSQSHMRQRRYEYLTPTQQQLLSTNRLPFDIFILENRSPLVVVLQSRGGGGHCLFEGRYPLPNYNPLLFGSVRPSVFFYRPLFLRIIGHRLSKSNIINTKLSTKVI